MTWEAEGYIWPVDTVDEVGKLGWRTLLPRELLAKDEKEARSLAVQDAATKLIDAAHTLAVELCPYDLRGMWTDDDPDFPDDERFDMKWMPAGRPAMLRGGEADGHAFVPPPHPDINMLCPEWIDVGWRDELPELEASNPFIDLGKPDRVLHYEFAGWAERERMWVFDFKEVRAAP